MMDKFRYYIVIILLAFFVFGSIAASAMANCDFASFSQSSTSIENALYDAIGDQYTAATAHDRHEEGAQHQNSSDEDSDSSECYNCDGNLCHTQSLVPVQAGPSIYDSSNTIRIEKNINLKSVFLSIIPDPPKQIS